MATTPTFEFQVEPEATLGEELLVGVSSPAMASLVAVDHLVSAGETTQVGHATVSGLPTITPFTEGVPRYPVRVYTAPDGPTLVVCELFVPLEIGDRFADALGGLAADHDIDEVTVLYGVPYPHGPDEHAVFSVATESYRRRGLDETGVRPLQGGFLDGTPGTLLQTGLAATGPAACALVTPAHPPGPDFEAAIRLLDVVEAHYSVDIDTTRLEERSAEVHRYYEDLAARIEAESAEQDHFEDRMYM